MENKTYYLKIDKYSFYNDLKNLYSTKLNILENYKKDFNTHIIILNRKRVEIPCILLDYIIHNYNEYLEKILLLCNRSISTCIITFMKNKFTNIHIILDTSVKSIISIQLDLIIKQISIKNSYRLVKFDKNSNIEFSKKINTNLLVDITNFEPILLIVNRV